MKKYGVFLDWDYQNWYLVTNQGKIEYYKNIWSSSINSGVFLLLLFFFFIQYQILYYQRFVNKKIDQPQWTSCPFPLSLLLIKITTSVQQIPWKQIALTRGSVHKLNHQKSLRIIKLTSLYPPLRVLKSSQIKNNSLKYLYFPKTQLQVSF